MALKDDVAELRRLLVTVLVDPSKTASNNRLVELVENIAAAVDGAGTDVTALDARVDAAAAVAPLGALTTPTTNEALLQAKIDELIAALAE